MSDAYQPIAIVLGSDEKPAKLRFIDTSNKSILERWLTERCLDDTQRYVFHVDNHWEIVGYNWLPIVDMNNNLIRDGISVFNSYKSVIGAGFLTDSNMPDVAINTLFGDSSMPLVIKFVVSDARGAFKSYSTRKLWGIANSDTNKTVFCNLDYNHLQDSRGNLVFRPVKSTTKVIIKDAELSQDLSDLSAALLQPGVIVTSSGVSLSADSFSQDSVIIPDTWKIIECDVSCNASYICFPDFIYNASISFTNCPNLKGIRLPKYISASPQSNSCIINISGCPKLEDLTLPVYSGTQVRVFIKNSDNFKYLRAPEGIIKGTYVKCVLENLPSLESVDLGTYTFDRLSITNTSVKKVQLSSRVLSYATLRITNRDDSYPQIIGTSDGI